jgi:DNA-binding NarL/FixJ family response regulator
MIVAREVNARAGKCPAKSSANAMISVLLVDDDLVVRLGLKMRIALEADLRVAGEARDGQEALDLFPTLTPDVVVMDFQMPRLDGIATAQCLRARFPHTGIVILSLYGDEETRARSQDAGVDFFIAKGENENELLHAIRASATKHRQVEEQSGQ